MSRRGCLPSVRRAPAFPADKPGYRRPNRRDASRFGRWDRSPTSATQVAVSFQPQPMDDALRLAVGLLRQLARDSRTAVDAVADALRRSTQDGRTMPSAAVAGHAAGRPPTSDG